MQREYARRFGVENHDVRFDIVVHSMGGLLTRYYLCYGTQSLPADGSLPTLNWAGTQFVERAVLVGTPSAVTCSIPGTRRFISCLTRLASFGLGRSAGSSLMVR